MTDLADRIRAALDETEAWARAASQTSAPGTPTGEHWRWECSHCDTVITINPVTDAYVECPDGCSAEVSLRSVEQYPTGMSYTLPAFIVTGEEVPATAGALIVRHDPAAVLRMVAAHRKILDEHDRICDQYNDPKRTAPMAMGPAYGLWLAIVALAEAYGVEA
jgi:hypothetical protein